MKRTLAMAAIAALSSVGILATSAGPAAAYPDEVGCAGKTWYRHWHSTGHWIYITDFEGCGGGGNGFDTSTSTDLSAVLDAHPCLSKTD